MNNIRKRLREWSLRFKEKHGYGPAWFLRYAAGGTLTAIVELVIYFFLLYWTLPWRGIVALLPKGIQAAAADENRLWAIVVSNLISYVFNYFISKYWVFRSPETKHRRDATLFALSSAANLAVVLISAKLILLGLELIPISGELWENCVSLAAKIGSNAAAFVTVLIFKRFVIWKDVSKY